MIYKIKHSAATENTKTWAVDGDKIWPDTILAVGILVDEGRDYITLAREHNGTAFKNVVCIPKNSIIEKTVLDESDD